MTDAPRAVSGRFRSAHGATGALEGSYSIECRQVSRLVRAHLTSSAALVLVALAAACSAASGDQLPELDTGSLLPYGDEYRRLYTELAQGGASVKPGVPIIWTAEMAGHFMRVDGADVQVFEYVSIEEASRGAAKVARDGSYIGLSTTAWVGQPHFYRRGRLMVLYVGDDVALQRRLQDLLGPQFAGHTSSESSQ